MEAIDLLKTFSALVVVLGAILAVLYLVKKFNLHHISFTQDKDTKIDEIVNIDTKNKIVVVSHLDQKYILLLGSNNLVIDKIRHKVAPKFDV
ncbi:MAG: hypothetical protein ACK5WS_00185 [Alphaproteobacteria bacterium]|jgi:flagellar biogenesis protein FliO|nr:flagellar biosynthetic protein FliO [Candidatus Jidaibacter sp.]